jgi:hypothetical protein
MNTLSLKTRSRSVSAWFGGFFVCCVFLLPVITQAAEVTISGTLYSDEGTTPITSGATIKLAVGTSTPSVHSTTTDSGTGTFSFTIDNSNGYAANTPLVVFVDGDPTTRAAVITKASSTSANITSLDLYQDTVIVRDEGALGLTLSDLAVYDSTDDADLQYTASTTLDSLTILDEQELHIWSGDTFINAASSTLTGSFHNEGIFNHNTGRMNLSGTGETLSGTLSGSSVLGSVIVSGSYTMSDNASTTFLTVESGGSLIAPNALTITEQFSQNGTFDSNGGILYSGQSTAWGDADSGVVSVSNDQSDFVYAITSDFTGAIYVAGYYYNLANADADWQVRRITPNGRLAGTLTGDSALGDVIKLGTTTLTIADNASTSDLTLTAGTTTLGSAAASTTVLDVRGDFINEGVFTANSGEVMFGGTVQQTATGTLTGTSAFNNITITNTSGNGTTSRSIIFGAPLSVTNIFTMTASTSAAFLAGATSTFAQVDWQGTSESPVWLRSTATGTEWYLDITNDQLTVDHVNVRDSNALLSTDGVVYAFNSFDATNNTNWDFDPQYGSSTISNHDATQVNNAFSFQNKINEALFAFKLTPESGTTTITELIISLSGAKKIQPSDFTNLRLYRDFDNDAEYDATDEQVGGAGVIVLDTENRNGTITFSTDFLATTSQNYVLIADWNAPDNSSFLTLNLYPSGISSLDDVGAQTIHGSVDAIQHHRNNQGGSISRSIDNLIAPPVTPRATTTGGGPTGGEEIGDDPDFRWPTAHDGPWNNGAYAYDQVDSTYATTNTDGATTTLYNHDFPISGNTIGGITIQLEVAAIDAGGTIDVQLSWDGGTSWTSAKATSVLTTGDTVVTLGSNSDKWGRSAWSAADFSDANFRVRLTGNTSSNTIYVDALKVKVDSFNSGGGTGGGIDI